MGTGASQIVKFFKQFFDYQQQSVVFIEQLIIKKLIIEELIIELEFQHSLRYPHPSVRARAGILCLPLRSGR